MSGIAGSDEVDDTTATGFVLRAINEYPAGDVALEDASGRSLVLYWSAGRIFAMKIDADGDSEVAVERAPTSGPDVEFTLDNGQVDVWPWRATVDAAHARAIVDGWINARVAPVLTWTADPPTLD